MSDLSPEDIALLEAQLPVGILMPDDDTMRLVHVKPGVVEAHVGPAAEAVTTTGGLVFWFSAAAATGVKVNRVASLNLLAVSDFSPRTVPLLRGPVLAASQHAGHPDGLTLEQMTALQGGPVRRPGG